MEHSPEQIDFVMTYPCYVPMSPEQRPILVDVGEYIAFVLCTDADLSREFAKTSLPGNCHVRQKLDSKTDLIKFLNAALQVKKHPGNPNLTHVLIDPRKGSKLPHCYPISQFLHHVQAGN